MERQRAAQPLSGKPPSGRGFRHAILAILVLLSGTSGGTALAQSPDPVPPDAPASSGGPVPATASDIRIAAGPEIAALYDEGNFLAAAALAEKKIDAPSLAMAARALTASVLTRQQAPESYRKRVERAITAAERAIRANPRQIEAHLQLAAALGLKARLVGPLAGARQGLATRARDAAAEAVRLDPSLPWGYAFLGIWNVEVVNAGGPIGARLLGANLKEGLRQMEAALQRNPPDPVVGHQIALALAGLDAKRHRALIQRALAASLSVPADDFFERAIRRRAEDLSAVLKRENKGELRDFLKAQNSLN